MTEQPKSYEVQNSQKFEKVRVKEGFYTARMYDVKEREKEGKFGKQLLLIYELLQDGSGKDVFISREGKKEHPRLAMIRYAIFTKNSKITEDFSAMGWIFPEEELHDGKEPRITPADFIGTLVKVVVEDYVQDIDGKKVTSSVISKVKKLVDDEDEEETP